MTGHTGNAADERARALVLRLLKHPAVAAIDFTIGSTHVTPSWYQSVFDAVTNRDIFIAYDPGLKSVGAKYIPEWKLSATQIAFDIVAVGYNDLSIMNQKEQVDLASQIVHESTHAAIDLRKVTIQNLLNECTAYVAGNMFLIKALQRTANIYNAQSLHWYAWELAAHLDNGSIVDPAWWINYVWKLNQLGESIKLQSVYSEWQKEFKGDGVGKTWVGFP